MDRAIAFRLLAFSVIALGGDILRSRNEQAADDVDDVHLVQLVIEVDSGKENVSATSTGLVSRNKYEKVPIEELQVDDHPFEQPVSTTSWTISSDYPLEEPLSTTVEQYDNLTAFDNVSSVQLNAAGDLSIFLAGLEFDLQCVIFFMIVFIVLLRYFPNIYAFRATGAYLEGEAKRKAQNAPFTWQWNEKFYLTWIWYACAPTREQQIESCGLDASMLLGFTDMAIEILTGIGLPFLIILCPMYAFLGGNAAGGDRLSHLGIGNVEFGSWIFWPVSLSTWFVVIFVQWRLFIWMRYFIEFRKKFLLTLPKPQCTTVLVQGIPEEMRSDYALQAYFAKIYGNSTVKDAYVVKKCAGLEKKLAEFRHIDRKLKETLFWIKHNTDKPKPRFHFMYGGQECDAYYAAELTSLGAAIKAEQEQINLEATRSPEDTNIYADNGFVTFHARSTVQEAMGTRLRIADDELVVSYPPVPEDIIWGDLEETAAGQFLSNLFGYGCIVLLFLSFMPIVLAISQAADIRNLETKFPWFKSFTNSLGDYRDTLAAELSSMGLLLMMSFLPTFLVLIFDTFFTLIASRWAQLYIQTYYFWFLILFVLLITAVGSSLTSFLTEIAESPFVIFSKFAETLPQTTHFYLNYICAQYFSHAMNLTRYINLTKYIMFRRVSDIEDARAMSEPEDQDYYGMGSRSARFSFMLVLGLVFGSICPLMILMTWINFVLCKIVYGYLIQYAEEKKKDLGGNHFALQLVHVHLGLLIYLIMMTGMILARASTYGPGILCASCFVWWAISFHKFHTKLHWERLCYEDVVGSDESVTKVTQADYKQEALKASILEKIRSDP